VFGGTINERGNTVVTAVNSALTKSAWEFPLQSGIVLLALAVSRGTRATGDDSPLDIGTADRFSRAAKQVRTP
jgi:hypothetical protein